MRDPPLKRAAWPVPGLEPKALCGMAIAAATSRSRSAPQSPQFRRSASVLPAIRPHFRASLTRPNGIDLDKLATAFAALSSSIARSWAHEACLTGLACMPHAKMLRSSTAIRPNRLPTCRDSFCRWPPLIGDVFFVLAFQKKAEFGAALGVTLASSKCARPPA